MPAKDETWNNLPMATCPHCQGEFQKDDYYDVEPGDEWECPLCGEAIHVTFVDHTIQVQLSTAKED